MKFNKILKESVIYNEKMIRIKNALETEMLNNDFINDIYDNRNNSSYLMNVYFAANNVIEGCGYKIEVFDNTEDSMKGTGKANPKFRVGNMKFEDNIEIRSDKISREVGLDINKSKENIKKFIIRFIEIFMHELLHLQQDEKKVKEEYPEKYPYTNKFSDVKDYYKRKKETMAFALQAAKEMKNIGWSKSEMLSATKKDFTDLIDVEEYVDWKSVLKYFYDYVNNHYEEL